MLDIGLPVEILFQIIDYLEYNANLALYLVSGTLQNFYKTEVYNHLINNLRQITRLIIDNYNLKQLIHLSEVCHNQITIECSQSHSLIFNQSRHELHYISGSNFANCYTKIESDDWHLLRNIIQISSGPNATLFLDNDHNVYYLKTNHLTKFAISIKYHINESPPLYKLNDCPANIIKVKYHEYSVNYLQQGPRHAYLFLLTTSGDLYLKYYDDYISVYSDVIDFSFYDCHLVMVTKSGQVCKSNISDEYCKSGITTTVIPDLEAIIALSSGKGHTLLLDKYG